MHNHSQVFLTVEEHILSLYAFAKWFGSPFCRCWLLMNVPAIDYLSYVYAFHPLPFLLSGWLKFSWKILDSKQQRMNFHD